MSHVPGPYTLSDGGEILSPSGITLAVAIRGEEGELFAAAPDLLEALRDLLRVSMMEFTQDGFDNWQRETIAAEDRASLAIAKATAGKP